MNEEKNEGVTTPSQWIIELDALPHEYKKLEFGNVEAYVHRQKVIQLIAKELDRATLAERKRCAEIINKWFEKEMEANKGSRLTYEQLGEDKASVATAIEKA